MWHFRSPSLRMRRAGMRSWYSRHHRRFLRRKFLEDRLERLRFGIFGGKSWATAALVFAMEQQYHLYLNRHPRSLSPLAAFS